MQSQNVSQFPRELTRIVEKLEERRRRQRQKRMLKAFKQTFAIFTQKSDTTKKLLSFVCPYEHQSSRGHGPPFSPVARVLHKREVDKWLPRWQTKN